MVPGSRPGVVPSLRRSVAHLAGLMACLLVFAAFPASGQDGEMPRSTGVRLDGSSAAAPADAPGSPGTPVVERVAEGLDAPAVLAFGPDGTLYYGELKKGNVYKIGEHGGPVDYGNPVLDVGTPSWGHERGFLGMDIDEEGVFYTFTTYARNEDTEDWFNRVSKWVDGQEVILLDDLPAANWHNAGRIQLEPGTDVLWVSYGDVNARMVSQDLDDLRGSLLRMTRDGAPAPGNVAPDSYIWSYGHRQPFSFAVDPDTGRVMMAENMDKENDEVNFVEAGSNHGWPHCEGPCDPPRDDLVDPVIHYPKPIGPTSGTWFHGDYYFGTFNTGALHRIYQHDGLWFDEIVYDHNEPSILDLKPGPEGNTLYFTTWNSIWRLTFPDVEADPDGGTPIEPNDGEPGNGDGGLGASPGESRWIPAPGVAVAIAALGISASWHARRRV